MLVHVCRPVELPPILTQCTEVCTESPATKPYTYFRKTAPLLGVVHYPKSLGMSQDFLCRPPYLTSKNASFQKPAAGVGARTYVRHREGWHIVLPLAPWHKALTLGFRTYRDYHSLSMCILAT